MLLKSSQPSRCFGYLRFYDLGFCDTTLSSDPLLDINFYPGVKWQLCSIWWNSRTSRHAAYRRPRNNAVKWVVLLLALGYILEGYTVLPTYIVFYISLPREFQCFAHSFLHTLPGLCLLPVLNNHRTSFPCLLCTFLIMFLRQLNTL